MADFQSLVKRVDKTEMSSLVPADHYNMAIRGLRQLLLPELRGETCFGWEPEASRSRNQQCLDSAILILPLINDYLKHYMGMLEATLDMSSSTSSTSASSSSSFDISSESPTGSVGLFLKTVTGFANDLENLCIASLYTLHELTACPGIREVLMHTEPGHTMETHMEIEVTVIVILCPTF